jgi:catalase
LAHACAGDFLRDAFSHLKASALSPAVRPLLTNSGVEPGGAVFKTVEDPSDFIAAAKTRQWERVPMLRPVP